SGDRHRISCISEFGLCPPNSTRPSLNFTCVSLEFCMIRALIFDFNGVLANDDPIHMEAFREAAKLEGLSFTDEEYLDTYLPLNDWDCFKILFATHARPLTETKLNDLIQRKSAYYFRTIADKTVLFSEAAAAVKAAALRCPLAIASGARAEEIRHILMRGGLQACFSAIIAAEDVQFGKPHPEPFLRAHEKLSERDHSLKLSDCVAIENLLAEFKPPQGPGMQSLPIPPSSVLS